MMCCSGGGGDAVEDESREVSLVEVRPLSERFYVFPCL